MNGAGDDNAQATPFPVAMSQVDIVRVMAHLSKLLAIKQALLAQLHAQVHSVSVSFVCS